MEYFAIQVKTRDELQFMQLFKALNPDLPIALHFPQRRVYIRRKGILRQETAPVFPGYIFAQSSVEQIIANQWAFRRTKGFCRFLKSNQDICPISGKDLELILHFLKYSGAIAGISRVFFNDNSRIVVAEGPLMGLEGCIIKVDKRKRRAKVKLSLYDNSFAIDLAFEVMESLDRL